jgi:hypothetical protein
MLRQPQEDSRVTTSIQQTTKQNAQGLMQSAQLLLQARRNLNKSAEIAQMIARWYLPPVRSQTIPLIQASRNSQVTRSTCLGVAVVQM